MLNFVSLAYDLECMAQVDHLPPRGGIISAVLAPVVMPWTRYSNPVVVNYFLGELGAFLGPRFGITTTDY